MKYSKWPLQSGRETVRLAYALGWSTCAEPFRAVVRKFRPSVRSCIAIAFAAALSAGASLADASNDTGAAEKLACEGKPQGGGLINFSCPLVSRGTPQRYSLKATFLGSHDDTDLSMVPTINGKTVTCDEGAKTSSMYEDGEITLECKFGVTALAGTQQFLMIRLKWYHAQLDTVAFVSEQAGTN